MGLPDGMSTRARYFRNRLNAGATFRTGLRRAGLAGAALALAALSALAAPLAAQAITDSRADELRHLVRQDCGSCHGLRLTGGLGAPITAEALEGRDPDDLALLILDGMPGTAMPGWRPLLEENEARWIAEYLLKGDQP